MKKILENMIIKWHQAGYALDEITPLVPQVTKAEIAAIIHQYDDKETGLCDRLPALPQAKETQMSDNGEATKLWREFLTGLAEEDEIFRQNRRKSVETMMQSKRQEDMPDWMLEKTWGRKNQ